MTIKSIALPTLLGAGGYSIGGSMGIALMGTAISASWPLATVLAMLGGSAVYIAGDTKDWSCPKVV